MTELLVYTQNLYSKGMADFGADLKGDSTPQFSVEAVEYAIRKLANGKACDSLGLFAKLLKWGKAIERRLDAATGHYYAFENMCIQ